MRAGTIMSQGKLEWNVSRLQSFKIYFLHKDSRTNRSSRSDICMYVSLHTAGVAIMWLAQVACTK
jgi:hypothetical protein